LKQKIKMKALQTYSIYFLVLVYLSGIIGIIFNPSFFLPFSPYSLLLSCFVFIINQPFRNYNFLKIFFTISIIGFMIEAVGVKTGFVFGSYVYGNNLGYKTLGVPIIISFNWALIVCSSIILTSKYIKQKLGIALIAASIGTGIDYIMEHVVVKLDYWRFNNGIADIQNYLAWFVLIFIMSQLFSKYLSNLNYKISFLILSLQVLFFGLIFLIK
jgi:bisanhydrobacterioruberin hydratase